MERDGRTVTRDPVFGNFGSIVSFQVGPDDGEELARQLSKYDNCVATISFPGPRQLELLG